MIKRADYANQAWSLVCFSCSSQDSSLGSAGDRWELGASLAQWCLDCRKLKCLQGAGTFCAEQVCQLPGQGLEGGPSEVTWAPATELRSKGSLSEPV